MYTEMKNYLVHMIQLSSLTAIVVIFLFSNCRELNNSKKTPYNPGVPIEIESFTPDSGRVATQMLIHGKNFGSDVSKINVIVKDDKKASVIGVNDEGTIIYCIVPTLKGSTVVSDGELDSTYIKIRIDEQEAISEQMFYYTYTQNVSTFLGFTDQDGNSAIVDGDFEIAQFQNPFWLAFDKETIPGVPRNFFLIEENNGLRYIDMQERKVETIFRTGNGVGRPRTIAFTLDYDTMIIANDAGNWTNIGTVILPRDPVLGKFTGPWKSVMNHKQCNGGAVHPITGEYWFNSFEKSQVYKVVDRSTIPWKYGNATGINPNGTEGLHYFFLVQDNNWEFNIQIAPSGDFAYIVSKNKHYIERMEFNHLTGNFEKPQPFVGMKNQPGFKDGVGLNAQFNQPHQGTFDNDDNFYIAAGLNHCIRKITPTGQVSTYAGRPGQPGYSDGAPRDAQFQGPFGIIFDDINQTFYIAERGNSRIRAITVQ